MLLFSIFLVLALAHRVTWIVWFSFALKYVLPRFEVNEYVLGVAFVTRWLLRIRCRDMLLVLTDLKEDSAKWPELLATCVPKAGGEALALPLGCPSEYLKRIDGIISGQTTGSQLYIYIHIRSCQSSSVQISRMFISRAKPAMSLSGSLTCTPYSLWSNVPSQKLSLHIS